VIAKIFGAREVDPLFERIAEVSVDFNGDRPDGEVDVVAMKSFLGDGAESESTQTVGVIILKHPDLCKIFLARDGSVDQLVFGDWRPDAGLVGFGGDSLSFFERSVLESHEISGASVSAVNTIDEKPSANGGSANAVAVGEGEFGLTTDVAGRDVLVGDSSAKPVYGAHGAVGFMQTGRDGGLRNPAQHGDLADTQTRFIELDKIVDVSFREVVSHDVYTIETPSGMYVAGGVVVKNCRCFLRMKKST
jgi:hypothetical protein